MRITSGCSAELRPPLMTRMARYRHRVFVEKLGWQLHCRDALELDQFDRDDTVYVIAQNEDGEVIGTARLLPTTRPYLLAEVDAALFGSDTPPIGRAEALEAIRPYIERHLREGGVMHHITRHVLGLAQGFPGARRFRQLLSVDVHKTTDPLGLLDQAAELLRGR